MNFKLIILAIIVVVLIIIAVGFLFVSPKQPATESGGQTGVQQKQGALSTDTTSSILNDLKQIPDDSSVEKTMESFGKTLEEF